MALKMFENIGKTKEIPEYRGTGSQYGGYSVAAPAGAAIYGIAIEKIQPNPSQPRRVFTDDSINALADSIRQYGLIQPVVVRSCYGSFPDGEGMQYELVEGERRLRAAKLLGLREMPCIIINTDSRRSAEIALTENIQREQLNMFDEANAIMSMMDIYSLSRGEMAKKLACNEEDIAKKLELLRLSPEEKAAVISNKLTERHVSALLRLKSEERRRSAIKQVIGEGMSAEGTERLVASILDPKTESHPISGKQVVLMRDVKAFFNTLDRAVEVMKNAGIDVRTERTDKSTETEIVIRIPNTPLKKTV